MLKKAFRLLLCEGDLWAVDRAGVCDLERSLEIIENYTVKAMKYPFYWLKSGWFGLALILLKQFAQILKIKSFNSGKESIVK